MEYTVKTTDDGFILVKKVYEHENVVLTHAGIWGNHEFIPFLLTASVICGNDKVSKQIQKVNKHFPSRLLSHEEIYTVNVEDYMIAGVWTKTENHIYVLEVKELGCLNEIDWTKYQAKLSDEYCSVGWVRKHFSEFYRLNNPKVIVIVPIAICKQGMWDKPEIAKEFTEPISLVEKMLNKFRANHNKY